MKLKPQKVDDIESVRGASIYPEPFKQQVSGRLKRKLGDVFNLQNFGINLTELAPGSVSALAHYHARQDEFIYVLSGTLTLVLDDEEVPISAGECMGFPAGSGVAHQLRNDSAEPAQYLEMGDRGDGDEVVYPNDDLAAVMVDGKWQITHKDGTPY